MDNDGLEISLADQPQDVPVLPDMYNKELTRKKNMSYTQNPNENDIDGVGGYREWKTKNGMDISERMVSSLGRTLHNQGMMFHNDEFYGKNHYTDKELPFSSSGVEYQDKGLVSPRLNASEPCYSLQQHKIHINTCEPAHRTIDQSNMRSEANGHFSGRPYHFRSSDICQDEQYQDRCYNTQCCPNVNVPPSFHSNNHHQVNMNHREHYNRVSSKNLSRNEYNYTNSDLQEERVNDSPHQKSHYSPRLHQIHHTQKFQNCHSSIPTSCQCCQNLDGIGQRPISPQKKAHANKKSEASIKKLYRILWLQNEQLGLLEKQVSKLIELNFKNSSIIIPEESATLNKTELEINQSKKVETCDVGIMADLPCLHCTLNEQKNSSSESKEEVAEKPQVEESLTLHGVEIPVRTDEISSPPVSMHIDMQEYQESSSSELDESDTSEEESEPVGWTFYDNVVGQVNHILKTANKKKSKRKNTYKDDINIAVEHLKHIGITVPEYDTNNPKRVTFEEGLKEQQINLRAQSEISMNFNALASKYLSSAGNKVQDISMCNVISNTNMSLATMRYLERHQITNRDTVDVVSKKPFDIKSKKSRHNEKAVTSKFLDITAIRQQPKLLPKDI